jgi:hypothetical protein
VQTGRAACVEDAFSIGALGRHVRNRGVAAQCGAWKCLRWTVRAADRRIARGGDHFSLQANAVFVRMPDAKLAALRNRGWQFYTFIGGGARFMFGWDSSPQRVDGLAGDIRQIASGAD